jgi:hypothetical protein
MSEIVTGDCKYSYSNFWMSGWLFLNALKAANY